MRKKLRLVLAVTVSGVILLAAAYFSLPLIYQIKEPFFVPPVEVGILEAGGKLPIRNDAFGNGHFGAKRGKRKHTGLDIQADLKSPVYASKSGWARATFIPNGYGHLVIIDHPGPWKTRYGHLSSSAVTSRWVNQGDIIGYVGKTGNANAKGMIPHLHFEIMYEDDFVDPEKEIAKKYEEEK
jgi:murein DD-endopeptidase MepM/ murein hydrolase activator NlpD